MQVSKKNNVKRIGKSFKIIPFAYQDIGYVCLRELIKMKVDIPFVITHKDSPCEKIWFRSVYKLSRKNRIPVYYAEDLSEQELKTCVEKEKPDLIVSLYYRKLFPEEVFSIPRMGSINLHGSFLPYYRGRCPVNWAILKGERFAGLTFHFIVRKPDAGDIIRAAKITINKSDRAIDIYKKMTDKAPYLLRRVISDFLNNRVKRIKQDEKKSTYFKGRKPEDGRINWNDTAENIYNLIRAVTNPYPGAFTLFKGKGKLYIWKSGITLDSSLFKKAKNFSHGQIVSISRKKGIIVKTGKYFLRCLSVEMDDSGKASGYIFAKHNNVKIGDGFY